MKMKSESVFFVFQQFILLIGLFLVLNLLFFVPDYYSMHFNTDICSNIDNQNFTAENLHRTLGYYKKACDSVLKAWKSTLNLPLTVRYHFLPAIISLLITGFYSYYRLLEAQYREKGWG